MIRLSYDVQGNLANKTATTGNRHAFDFGDPLGSAEGLGSYDYLADGRWVPRRYAAALEELR